MARGDPPPIPDTVDVRTAQVVTDDGVTRGVYMGVRLVPVVDVEGVTRHSTVTRPQVEPGAAPGRRGDVHLVDDGGHDGAALVEGRGRPGGSGSGPARVGGQRQVPLVDAA